MDVENKSTAEQTPAPVRKPWTTPTVVQSDLKDTQAAAATIDDGVNGNLFS